MTKNQQNSCFKKNVSGDTYLLQYAAKMGVKEEKRIAYINVVKKNGGAEAIIEEYKQIEANKRAMEEKTKAVIKANAIAQKEAVPPTQKWLELGEKLGIKRKSPAL